MNPKQIHQHFINRKYTDVIISLKDEENKHTQFESHQLILASASPFFEAQIDFEKKKCDNNNNGKSERILNLVTNLPISDYHVAYDIIASFYQTNQVNIPKISEWKYLLNTVKCRDFFGLDVKNYLNSLCEVNIPSEGYNLFLQVINLNAFSKNENVIDAILRNMPNNYDFTNFPKELMEIIANNRIYLVAGKTKKSIKIYNSLTGRMIKILNHNSYDYHWRSDLDYTGCIAFSFDNKKIISGDADGSVNIYSVNTGFLLNKAMMSDIKPIRCVCFSRKNSKIAIAGFACIQIWTVNGIMLQQIDYQRNKSLHLKTYISSIIFAMNDRILISGNNSGSIRIWNVKRGSLAKKLVNAHTENITSLLTYGNTLISASLDGYIKLWDLTNGEIIHEFKDTFAREIYHMALSSDETKLVVSYRGMIKILDINTRSYTRSIKLFGAICMCVGFIGKDRILAANTDGNIRIYDISSGILVTNINKFVANGSIPKCYHMVYLGSPYLF